MATTPKPPSPVYEKGDSFLAQRSTHPEHDSVLGRVAALAKALDGRGSLSDREEVVRDACTELLTGDGSRFRLSDFTIDEIGKLRDDAELERYLHFRFRYEVYPREYLVDDFPPLVHIEPTSICNYRCVFCYQTNKEFTLPKNGHMGLLPMDLFKQAVDELDGRCEAITFAARGEPTLHKQFGEMLRYLDGRFLAVKINTNASKLTEELCHAILQSGVQTLVFSADAASEPLYSQLRVRGDLETVLRNVTLFRDVRAKHYPDSRTITRVSGVKVRAEQDLEEMDGTWHDLVDQVAFVRYNPWENTYEQPVNEIETPCSEYWRRTCVMFDGGLNPCDTDYMGRLAVGKLQEDGGIAALWRGKRYEALRKLHKAKQRRDVFPCNRCTVV